MGVSTGKISFNGVDAAGLPAIVDLTVAGGHIGGAISYKVIDTSDNTNTALNAPGYIYGVSINTTLSAHTVVIKDATAALLTIPASTAAGTNFQLFGVYCATSIIVDPDDSSTGSLTIFYRAA